MNSTDKVYPSPAGQDNKGLSVRDHIAIEAMKSLIPVFFQIKGAMLNDDNIIRLCEESYKIADTMIYESE